MFKFKLALLLGRFVAEIDAEMGYGELREWIAFHAIEGLPDVRLDLAQLCMVTANSHGAKTKVDDWLPRPVAASVTPLSVDESVAAFNRATLVLQAR